MKKTVSVNIKGINFVIEEDAYELLQDYIDRLTLALKNEDGSTEIIEDVELRIAELCSAKLSDSKSVIEIKDIQEIIETLGEPEEYVDEEDIPQGASQSYSKDSKSKDKRLYRDTESAMIGGVAAGIANYFNIDVVLVRAIFVLSLFLGFGFLLYVIMWIIIPRAESTIDRLRMRGRPVTVETVKREVEDAAERVKSSSKSFASRIRREDNYKKRFSRGLRVISTIVGIGIIIFAFMQLIGFLVLVIGGLEFIPIQNESGYLTITQLGELFLSNAQDIKWAWIGILTGFISGLSFLFLLGSSLIFQLKSKVTKISLLGLFITGLIGFFICLSVGFRTARDLTVDGEIERNVGSVQTSELVIIPRFNKLETRDNFEIKSDGTFGLVSVEDNQLIGYGIDIEYIPSADSSFHILQSKSAQGQSHKLALKRSERIKHDVELKGDTLFVDVEYAYPIKDKLRLQDVDLTIEVPNGSLVKIKDKVIHLGQEDTENDDDLPFYRKEGTIYSDGHYHSHY